MEETGSTGPGDQLGEEEGSQLVQRVINRLRDLHVTVRPELLSIDPSTLSDSDRRARELLVNAIRVEAMREAFGIRTEEERRMAIPYQSDNVPLQETPRIVQVLTNARLDDSAEAIRRALEDGAVLAEADIQHSAPVFTGDVERGLHRIADFGTRRDTVPREAWRVAPDWNNSSTSWRIQNSTFTASHITISRKALTRLFGLLPTDLEELAAADPRGDHRLLSVAVDVLRFQAFIRDEKLDNAWDVLRVLAPKFGDLGIRLDGPSGISWIAYMAGEAASIKNGGEAKSVRDSKYREQLVGVLMKIRQSDFAEVVQATLSAAKAGAKLDFGDLASAPVEVREADVVRTHGAPSRSHKAVDLFVEWVRQGRDLPATLTELSKELCQEITAHRPPGDKPLNPATIQRVIRPVLKAHRRGESPDELLRVHARWLEEERRRKNGESK